MRHLRLSFLLRTGVTLVTLICSSTQHLHATEQQDTSVIGRWKLTAALDSSDITSIDDQEAEELVGQIITIDRDKVQLGARVCDSPSFEVTKAETNKFFRDQAHASAKNWDCPIPSPLST